jgi:hypothetical protein
MRSRTRFSLRARVIAPSLLAVALAAPAAPAATSPRAGAPRLQQAAASSAQLALAGQRDATEGADLRAAASRGDLDAVNELLQSGVPVDAANAYGATPLILASMNGHAEVVHVLLDAGADAQRADTFYQRTPLQWATRGGFEEIASLLFVAGAGDFEALFREAVEEGDPEQVSRLLNIQVPPEEVLAEALQQAIRTRNEPLAQLLMRFGAVPPPPTIVSVDAARLRLYEGRYVDEVGYELVIVADEQTRSLLVRPPGMRNPLRFLPVEESTFVAEQNQTIYIRFVVRDGRVVSMSFVQPGATRRMSKQ